MGELNTIHIVTIHDTYSYIFVLRYIIVTRYIVTHLQLSRATFTFDWLINNDKKDESLRFLNHKFN